MRREELNKIMDVAQGYLDPEGFECIEAEWNEHDQLLRLYVDNPSGVDMEACVKANSLLKDVSCIEGMEAGGYNLEVSSPGVERPLRRPIYFEESIGKEVSVHLAQALNGKRKLQGTLTRVHDEELLLECEQEEYSIPLSLIHKANIVFNWDS
ncbi:MAG: ribosome maturation factor RimP [Oligoflexales bacterium]|nr:ribosome maturation factor RimP [Oligoflexales bacterium]